jgi:CrcB protein
VSQLGVAAALLVALGGGVGAALRYLAGHHLDRHVEGGWPWGTLVVNVLGSAALGALSVRALSGELWALLATGFCGGLTTYSAFAVQTVGLGVRRGAAYVLVTVGLALPACVLAAHLAG